MKRVKVWENGERTAVICHRHVDFSKENMRLRSEKAMFHSLEIIFKTANVAEITVEKVDGSIKMCEVITMRTN